MLDLNTTEARRKVFAPTLDWLKAGGHAEVDGKTIGFDMGEVIYTSDDNDGDPVEDYFGNECGAVCCMLGHQKLTNGKIGEELDTAATTMSSPYFSELCELFFPDVRLALDIRYSQVAPAMAANVLERYIETGKVDWAEELS